jgi:putative FmdB family regulatory protein
MPLYEYQCDACGNRFEQIRKFSDPVVDVCPACGERKVQKLVSSPAIQFKGSGFYINDYARKGAAGGDGAAAPAKDSQESKDSKDSKDTKNTKDTSTKEAKDAKETKDAKPAKETKSTPSESAPVKSSSE